MTAKEVAITYFDRITFGHRNPVNRPERSCPFMERVDRHLRIMVENANHNGDCIVNPGFGYFRPIPHDEIDDFYYKSYKVTEHSKIEKMQFKEIAMDTTYNNWQKESEHWEKRVEETI